MSSIRVLFTVRSLNPASWLIRIANPVSFIKIAPASHAIAVDGDTGYGLEASAAHGVRRAPLAEMLKGAKIVKEVLYDVHDAEAGLLWLRQTAERHAKYDWLGALALGIAPGRKWQDESNWFCFEYVANGLEKAGRRTFSDNAHITAYMLMSLSPEISQS